MLVADQKEKNIKEWEAFDKKVEEVQKTVKDFK